MSDRIAARTLIVAGLELFRAVSAYWLAEIDVNTSFWTIAWCVVLSRIGLGFIKPSLNLAALKAAAPGAAGAGRRHDQLRAAAGRRVRRQPAVGDPGPPHVLPQRHADRHADGGQQRDRGAPARRSSRLLAQAGASPELQIGGRAALSRARRPRAGLHAGLSRQPSSSSRSCSRWRSSPPGSWGG